jgi:L-rhamnose-H+ transport protein
MNPVTPNLALGVFFHAIGALFAATCYTPQKKVRGWSWQTYWLTQASVCWLILPILGAWLTIPDLMAVLREAPHDAMTNSFLLGIVYGIGGTAFGIAIRYIGFSLTYAIAIGLSCVLGTLIPPLVKGTFGATMNTPGANWIIGGIAVGVAGIGVSGFAGRLKELDLAAGNKGEFSLVKGLLISLLAGVLSAVYGFALAAGEPIADVATAHGAGVWRGNVVYIFANTGAFLTTAIYCLYLHFKHKTLGELVELPAGSEKKSLPVNFVMAAVTGIFWYGQFFFYNLGHVRMGPKFDFTSWAIHMTMLVLFSSVVGMILREWRGCRRLTHKMIALALVILVGAVLMLTRGNYLGAPPAKADAAETAK